MNMKRLLLYSTIIFLFLSETVYSQESQTTLVCTGKYYNFPENIRDVDVNGSLIHITKNLVKVGIVGFSYSNGDTLDYKITSNTDSHIRFRFSNEQKKVYLGNLNRYSGEVSLTLVDPNTPNQIEQMFNGKCVPSRKLF